MKKIIDVTFPKGKQVNANMKGFDILSDQPVRAGGNGEAPSPFDFFLSSLATCAGFYAVSFCQSREIDTTGMSLELSREVDPETRLVSDIQIKLNLPEGFPTKYQKAIIKAMDQCSVKKHLDHPPVIETIVE
jgi:ribosomal protein S12 methylthiotransferase accessory factor